MKFHIGIKKRSLVWSLFLCVFFTSSQAQQFDWAQSIGGLGLDVGRAVTTDSEGNVFVAGSFTGATHLADTFLTGLGSSEAFVAKFTSEGDFLWANVISGPEEDMARGLVTDDEGNIYVVGHFTDTVVFSITELDTIAAKSEGMQDVFVVKYNASGQLLWKLTGGGLGNDTGTDIDWHKWSGKIYVSGGFERRAKFGTATLLSNGLTDAFLLKITGDGGAQWAKKGGGLEHDIAASLSVDQTNETIYVTGDFYDRATFETEEVVALGSSDMFLAKYLPDGTMEWIKANGGTSVDVATGIGTDLNGKVYVSGYYQGTTYFQNHSASAISYNDVFVAQFDAEGNCGWLSSAGSWGLDNAAGLAVDWNGTSYLTGMFEEEIITNTDSASGIGYDIFVLVHHPDGQVKYVRSAGAGSADIGMAACLGPDQSLYLTGYYFFFADFDNTTIGAADYGDCFLARMADILAVENVKEDFNKECVQVNSQGEVEVKCSLTGTWILTNTLGQVLAKGPVQPKIQLPTSDEITFFSLRTASAVYSKKLSPLFE